MSAYPLTSSPSSSISPSPTSNASDPGTPNNDHRILIVVIILGIAAAFLIAYIIYITMRLKRRQANGETDTGPYQGTTLHHDHPASNITPFGTVGPNSGKKGPRFNHNPGKDMRIAVRRPDGGWHFTDSRTPFTPAGVKDLDVSPSPVSSTSSFFSFHSQLPPGGGSQSKLSHEIVRNPVPSPSYYQEPCRDHFDDRQPHP